MTDPLNPDAIPDYSAFGPYQVPPGRAPANACMVFAHLLAESFDSFLIHALYAVAVRRCFEHARLFVYHGKIDPRVTAIPSLLPDITFTWRAGDGSSIPFEYFDSSNDAALRAGSERWYEQGCDKPDILLLPSMMNWRHLGAFERAPRLEVPRDRVSKINREVRDRGLVMNWWYCALAVPDPDELADPGAFMAAMRAASDIVYKQHGARLVLVGDPGTELPELPPGVLDLRDLAGDLLAQTYVISKARFLFELRATPWLWFAFGLDVPWLRRMDLATPIELPGRGALFNAALQDEAALGAAIRAMIAETRDCPMWRPGPRAQDGPAPNCIDLPMAFGPAARYLSI